MQKKIYQDTSMNYSIPLLIDIAKKIKIKEDELTKKQPYKFNLLKMTHAIENDHTKILVALLNYSSKQYSILTSFLKLMESFCDEACIQKLSFNPSSEIKISFDKKNIDCFIESRKKKFAVIIENKIQWAEDQNKQIERYVKTARDDFHIPENNIFVIYLTADGKKKITDASLTCEAKSMLDYSENDYGRFIELNYKEHILPWLKDDVLGKLEYRERYLIGGIEHYVAYLEQRFNAGNEDKEILKMKKEILKAELNWKENNLLENFEKITNLRSLMETTNEIYVEAKIEIFNNILKDIFDLAEKRGYQLHSEYFKTEYIFMKYKGFWIAKKDWKNCRIKFEFQSDNFNDLIYGLVRNGDEVDTKVFPDSKNWYRSKVWAYYKYMNDYRNFTDDVFKKLVNYPNEFIDIVIEIISEIESLILEKEIEV